jgi:hypothetical protein
MNPLNNLDPIPEGWLAFELGVLRRLQFRSVAVPFAGEGALDSNLRRWGVRVASNDSRQWAWTRARARVENASERLTDDDARVVLEDAYVPRHRLYNESLRARFGEADAWWFDNVRQNIEQLGSAFKRALALDLGIAVGDYALSFDAATRHLRQPLSRVFERLRATQPRPAETRQRNAAANEDARAFLAREQADLLFLRLPRPDRRDARHSEWAWREEWVRGNSDFWDEFEAAGAERLGARAETRRQYLRHLEELLGAAGHIPNWAVAHADDRLISTDELVETLRRLRRVGTVYTKDFSELAGVRATIVTA